MGMVGRLLDSEMNELFCTIELPWRDNKTFISCIPTGDYLCKWTWSPAFKRHMYLVDNVSGRSGIRIHKGSYAGATDYGYKADFLGCISLGKGYTTLAGQKILHTTAKSVAKFEEMMDRKDFILSITGEFPPLPPPII